MGGVSHKPQIENMVWSYSRIKAFDDCPYGWFLKYIRPNIIRKELFEGKHPTWRQIVVAHKNGELDRSDRLILLRSEGLLKAEKFFSNYGSFMHKLIELYYRGELSEKDMERKYLLDYRSEVLGKAPSGQIFEKYFQDGLAYVRNFKPLPYSLVGVEKRMSFNVGGYKFVGFIDYLGMDGDSYVIVDNKSKILQKRTGKSKPTVNDATLDEYLKQLYLYADAVKDEFGSYPTKLCFNCFRTNQLIEEPFSESGLKDAVDWVTDSIEEIKKETNFTPKVDYFKCTYLCDTCDCCEYYNMSKRGRS